MGDYCDHATKQMRHGGVYRQIMSPQEQLDGIIELFEPIKDKCLGLHEGNHEEGIFRGSGVDPTKYMCKALNVRNLGWSIFHRFRVGDIEFRGDQNYILYSTHGSSNAKLPHTKIRKCLELSKNFEANIYCFGHVHEIALHTETYRELDSRGYGLKVRKRYFILTGHFLRYEGSYAERMNLIPSKLGVPKITLFKDKWDVHVSF